MKLLRFDVKLTVCFVHPCIHPCTKTRIKFKFFILFWLHTKLKQTNTCSLRCRQKLAFSGLMWWRKWRTWKTSLALEGWLLVPCQMPETKDQPHQDKYFFIIFTKRKKNSASCVLLCIMSPFLKKGHPLKSKRICSCLKSTSLDKGGKTKRQRCLPPKCTYSPILSTSIRQPLETNAERRWIYTQCDKSSLCT